MSLQQGDNFMPAKEPDRTDPSEGRLNVPLKALLRGFDRFRCQIADTDARNEAADWLKRVRDEENQEDPPRAEVLQNFIRLCVRGRLQPLLAAYQIPHP